MESSHQPQQQDRHGESPYHTHHRPALFLHVPAIHHLRRMSSLTDFTPSTLRATSLAVTMFSCDLTKPLSCTSPLYVSTLISADLSSGSLKIAALTLVVMA